MRVWSRRVLWVACDSSRLLELVRSSFVHRSFGLRNAHGERRNTQSENEIRASTHTLRPPPYIVRPVSSPSPVGIVGFGFVRTSFVLPACPVPASHLPSLRPVTPNASRNSTHVRHSTLAPSYVRARECEKRRVCVNLRDRMRSKGVHCRVVGVGNGVVGLECRLRRPGIGVVVTDMSVRSPCEESSRPSRKLRECRPSSRCCRLELRITELAAKWRIQLDYCRRARRIDRPVAAELRITNTPSIVCRRCRNCELPNCELPPELRTAARTANYAEASFIVWYRRVESRACCVAG